MGCLFARFGGNDRTLQVMSEATLVKKVGNFSNSLYKKLKLDELAPTVIDGYEVVFVPDDEEVQAVQEEKEMLPSEKARRTPGGSGKH